VSEPLQRGSGRLVDRQTHFRQVNVGSPSDEIAKQIDCGMLLVSVALGFVDFLLYKEPKAFFLVCR
jgi:hypothetical protein